LEDPDHLAKQAKEVMNRFEETDALELAADLKQLVEILGSGLDRTTRLVSDLRDFAAPQRSSHEPFDLSSALQSTLELTGSTLREQGIVTKFQLGEGLPLALGDPSSINQVILNIIKNAADALRGQENAQINISVSYQPETKKLRISFADNGPGINPEDAGKLFDPFFTTKDAGKGTGLGLALCQRVIQEHNGSIWIESQPGEGATVNIEIPSWEESAH
jgi:signal transduction histidine kinase